MSRSRNALSVPTEIPARGALQGAGEDRLVGADGGPREGRLPGLRHPGADVVQDALLGLGQRQALVELVQQAGRRVHLAHEVAHLLERLGRGADQDVDPVAEHVELGVGDHRGALAERVGAEV